MKYEKFIVPVSVSAAVIAAAVAAIVVTNNRAAIARARATEAEALEAANAKAEKTARFEAETEKAKAQRAADEQQKKALESKILVDERAKAEAEERAAELAAQKARLDASTARDNAQAASDQRAAEKAKADAARAELDRVTAQIEGELAISNAAVAEATAKFETEKRKSDAIIAEAKALELRKIDFEQLERDLLEFKQELDERERALHPDATIYDSSNVTWVAEREADVIGGDTNRLLRARSVLPEDDPSLPKGSRELARYNRIRGESDAERLATSQERLIGKLVKLRDAARREGRVIDAEFYQKSIKSLNPDYQQ